MSADGQKHTPISAFDRTGDFTTPHSSVAGPFMMFSLLHFPIVVDVHRSHHKTTMGMPEFSSSVDPILRGVCGISMPGLRSVRGQVA